jgi:hypothetical protein
MNNKLIHKISNEFKPGFRTYEVAGSRSIKIDSHANCVCGNKGGIHIEFSNVCGVFDDSGAGGVLGRRDAKALADRIYEILEQCTDTEQELLDSVYKSIDEL